MVPPNWQHPKEKRINYFNGITEESFLPMHDRPYIEAISEWIDGHQRWEAGTHESLSSKYAEGLRYYAEYAGNPPSVEHYRPDWKPEEMTWFQVYETVSEGTPVTPPFATREELVEYLVENGDFWDQQRRADGNSGMNCEPWKRVNAEAFVFGDG